jgi:hypothetical protein
MEGNNTNVHRLLLFNVNYSKDVFQSVLLIITVEY